MAEGGRPDAPRKVDRPRRAVRIFIEDGMRRRTTGLGGRVRSGSVARPNQSVEEVLGGLKSEQAQLEKQMTDLLSLPRPTEVQNEHYSQLKASHTAVLERQAALHRSLLELAEQVRQSREVRQNMPHLSHAAAQPAELPLAQQHELRRRREEDDALEWAKADSLRENSAAAKTAGEAASEAAFEQQLRQAAEESLRSAVAPPPHPGETPPHPAPSSPLARPPPARGGETYAEPLQVAAPPQTTTRWQRRCGGVSGRRPRRRGRRRGRRRMTRRRCGARRRRRGARRGARGRAGTGGRTRSCGVRAPSR